MALRAIYFISLHRNVTLTIAIIDNTLMENLRRIIIIGLMLQLPVIALWAGVPPVLKDASTRMRADGMQRVFVTPKRVLWKQGEVDNEAQLLRNGTGQAEMSRQQMACRLKSVGKDTASVLLDYGSELHGGLKLVMASSSRPEPSLVRIRFGESVQECFSETHNSEGLIGYSTDDHAKRDIIVEIPRDGQFEIGNTGFRFVRIDLLRKGVSCSIREAMAVLRYRDIPYLGSFHSSDSRLDSIWMTGAWTVHLNMQEYIWDGIKRDRLIWLGDMHPETSTIGVVFGNNDVVSRTLDLAVQQYPLPQWLNGMMPYSMWYIIQHHDWYMQCGDSALLNRHRDYILGLIERFDQVTDSKGVVHGDYFLDWPSSPDKEGVKIGVHALLVWAMKDAEYLCNLWGDDSHAAECRRIVGRVEKNLSKPQSLKQAAALMTIAGIMQPDKAFKGYLVKGHEQGFSTFYGYYMLIAEAMAGQYKEALNVIRKYWGGMLDMGATTFWEDFSLDWMKGTNRIDELGDPGKKNIGDYGAYCYPGFRHSLCHGWASGPTAWMSHYVLGIMPVEPGCKTVTIDPHLGDLHFVEGTYPTPYGLIKVHFVQDAKGNISGEVTKPRQVAVNNRITNVKIESWN